MRIKLGIPMPLSKIAKASGGELISSNNAMINYVTTDSRELYPDDLFIALVGKRYDGENYLDEAKSRGAFILSRSKTKADIYHPKTDSALLSFAEKYAENLPIILYKIGITGSVGKTTTKEFLKVLLEERYKCHVSSENFNNEIGMPMSILSAPHDTEILIMEMGMNHPGEIRRLSQALKPNIAIITNVGTAHIGNLGSRESIAKAKLEICDGMDKGITIVPLSEPLLTAATGRRTFSLFEGEADYCITENEDSSLSILKADSLYCQASFIPEGNHHRLCLAAAASAAIEVGLTPSELSSRIHLISKDKTRQNVFRYEKYHFYTDFYNASYESVIALVSIAEKYKTDGKKSLVLGDILELGEMSPKIHFSIGKSISAPLFHNLFLYGKESENIRLGAMESGFPEERIFSNHDIEDPDITARQIRNHCEEGEVIFMKASRSIRLERVLNCFMTKGEKND